MKVGGGTGTPTIPDKDRRAQALDPDRIWYPKRAEEGDKLLAIKDTCFRCNKQGHKSPQCFFDDVAKYGASANFENKPWKDSSVGLKLKGKGYFHALPHAPEHYESLISAKKTPEGGKLNTVTIDKNNEKAYVNVNVCRQASGNTTQKGDPVSVTTLLDTSAAFNFVSTKFVKRFKIPFININDTEFGSISNFKKLKVCSTLSGVDCTTVEHIAKLSIEHISTPVGTYTADFIVGAFDDDLIIGRPTLAKHNVLLGYPEQFFNLSPGQTAVIEGVISLNATSHTPVSQTNSTRCFCHNKSTGGVVDDDQPLNIDSSAKPSKKKRTRVESTHKNNKKVQPRQTVQSADGQGNMDTSGRTSPLFLTVELNALNNTTSELATQERSEHFIAKDRLSEHIVVDGRVDPPSSRPSSFSNNYSKNIYAREDIYEISDDMMESIPSGLLKDPTSTFELPTNISGPEPLQRAIKSLIYEYRDIFSTSVSTTPADVTPFNFSVDERLWETEGNKSGPRRYDSSKALEIKNTVTKLLAAGVIRPSKASYYSHGFVVPKSTPDEWRFVVDYKRLNKISSKEQWPLPNIEAILHRIGDKKPKYFNVMDMTSGYHQAPIAESCRHLTAFMTADGLYEWNRLPMGPSGAGSYIQKDLKLNYFLKFTGLE